MVTNLSIQSQRFFNKKDVSYYLLLCVDKDRFFFYEKMFENFPRNYSGFLRIRKLRYPFIQSINYETMGGVIGIDKVTHDAEISFKIFIFPYSSLSSSLFKLRDRKSVV